jgi:hypothetical protein
MSGRPLFNDEIAGSLVHAIIPKDAQDEMLSGPEANFIFCMMAVRTAAIDRFLVRSALDILSYDVQVVLIGAGGRFTYTLMIQHVSIQAAHALHSRCWLSTCCLHTGMDTRAWRLPVPDRQLSWFEVDTNAVLECKPQFLAAKPTLHSRCCVPADVTDGSQLEQGLLQAGRQRDEPHQVMGDRNMPCAEASARMRCNGTCWTAGPAGSGAHASLHRDPPKHLSKPQSAAKVDVAHCCPKVHLATQHVILSLLPAQPLPL